MSTAQVGTVDFADGPSDPVEGVQAEEDLGIIDEGLVQGKIR